MKIAEYRQIDAGLGGGRSEVRVRELEEGEEKPEEAKVVSDDAPVFDWTPTHLALAQLQGVEEG